MFRSATIVVALVAATSGCASTPDASEAGLAGLAPILSVERFLQAANTRDLQGMARMFGNADGSIADQSGCAFKRIGSWIGLSDTCIPETEIELRMNAISLIVQHDDYQIRSEAPVPGRTSPTTRVGVDIERGTDRFEDVPFVVVRASDGRWLVEEIGLQLLTVDRGLPFDELPEHTAGRAGMDEGDEMPSRTGSGTRVDRFEPLAAKPLQGLLDVGHSHGHVMHARAVPIEESLDGAFRTVGFEQLDLAHEADLHPLRG